MLNKSDVSPFFKEEQIPLYAVLPIFSCKIINESLLARSMPDAKSVIIFAVPYYAGAFPERNISLYALSRDYHLYLKGLNARLIAFLKDRFPTANFAGFGDHSPIAERHAAATAGLGILGDNGMLITKKYGSYVFIGEMFINLETSEEPHEVQRCPSCGACKQICPGHFETCASGIGQRKGALTTEEECLVKKTGLVWGCDLCQTVCPYNRAPKITPITFFKEDLYPYVTAKEIQEMSKEEFASRAFGWRGKQPLLRNLQLFEEVET